MIEICAFDTNMLVYRQELQIGKLVEYALNSLRGI